MWCKSIPDCYWYSDYWILEQTYITKTNIFWPNFYKWVPFWVPRLLKICFSNGFYYYVCRKGFCCNDYVFYGNTMGKWPFFWNLGTFGAISRYPDYEMFFPCIISSSMIFSHQLSCFNIHNVQKIAFFAQIFTKWGLFWAPRFL